MNITEKTLPSFLIEVLIRYDTFNPIEIIIIIKFFR